MIKPTENRVVIQPDTQPNITEGGIHLPDTAKPKPVKGTIVAVGPGKMLPTGKRTKVALKVGAKVFYAPYAGNEVKLQETTFLIMSEEDVLAEDNEV